MFRGESGERLSSFVRVPTSKRTVWHQQHTGLDAGNALCVRHIEQIVRYRTLFVRHAERFVRYRTLSVRYRTVFVRYRTTFRYRTNFSRSGGPKYGPFVRYRTKSCRYRTKIIRYRTLFSFDVSNKLFDIERFLFDISNGSFDIEQYFCKTRCVAGGGIASHDPSFGKNRAKIVSS